MTLLALVVLAEPDDARHVGHQRRALRRASLEQLDHAGQTVRDVLTRHTTGVEGTHRELGTRLTDRLGGDDADGLTEVGDLAGCEHAAVAARAHTRHRLAGEHRTHAHARDVRVVGDEVHPVVVDLGVARDDRAVGEREVFGEAPAEQARLEQTPALRAGQHVFHPDAADRVARDLAHDQLLRDVDESTGQVAGVGGTERGVGETLASTVRRDEVLEDRQAFTEVALDRARDDLTTRVGDETAHTGDLTHLHDVSSGARADHHVDGVELRRLQQVLHGLRHLVGGVGPDLDLLLTTLVVGDDAAVVLALDLGRLALELLEQTGLGRRRGDVGDRDGEPGAGRPLVPEGLHLVEAVGDDRLVVEHDELADDLGDVALAHRPVDEREVVGERGVEQEPPEGRFDEHRARAVVAVLAQHDALRACRRLASGRGKRSTGNLPAGIRTFTLVCSDTVSPSAEYRSSYAATASSSDANTRPVPAPPSTSSVM